MKHALAVLLLSLTAAAHAWAQCGNPLVSPIVGNYSVCGQLLKLTATAPGFAVPGTSSYLKICPVMGFGTCHTGRSGECDKTYPYTCYPYRYNFAGFLNAGDANQWFNVYVWNDGEWWGSDRTPIGRVYINDHPDFGWENGIFYARPRPLPPNPVYPANNVQAPSSFTLEWESGMTPDRALAGAPVTYDIYYKYWPYDSSEPANYSVFTGMPCNPLPNGHCSTPEVGLADGNYKWYVKVNLDVSNYVPAEVRPAIISFDSTQTGNGTFNVGYFSRLPGCCR